MVSIWVAIAAVFVTAALSSSVALFFAEKTYGNRLENLSALSKAKDKAAEDAFKDIGKLMDCNRWLRGVTGFLVEKMTQKGESEDWRNGAETSIIIEYHEIEGLMRFAQKEKEPCHAALRSEPKEAFPDDVSCGDSLCC